MTSPAGDRLPVLRLLVLAGAIFVSVTSEFLPTGVLVDMSLDLGVSESRIGLLVTAFAGTVVLSAAPLTVLTRRYSRKWLLVVALAVFAVSNLIAGIAPGYELLLGARVLGGAAHGLFWAVVGPYTALIVSRGQLARAVSITIGGGTAAFVLGVPVGAWIGHAVGWRWAFGVMALAVAALALVVGVFLPHAGGRVRAPRGAATPRWDRSAIALGIVGLSVLLVATGHNILYTYVAAWSVGAGGVGPDQVSLVLFAYGAAGVLGLLAAGAYGDRAPRLTLGVMLAVLIASVLALGATTGAGPAAAVPLLVVWSASFAGMPALFQTRALHGASPRIRDLSGAVVTTSFNLAIGGGALFGGFVIDGWGIAALPWVTVAVVAAGTAWVLATDRARIAASDPEESSAEG